MKRVQLYVHGNGRGHANRCAYIASRLRGDGHRVRVWAGGHARDLLGADHAPRAPLRPGWAMPLELTRRILADGRRLRRERPDVIVSDGDQAALAAGRARGIPTIAVGHGLVFAGCALPSDLPAPSLWHQRANTVIPTTLAHFRVAVHFLPCRPSGAGVTVARPDLDPLLSAASSSDDGTIVGYFRFGRSRAVMAALRAEGLEVRAFGSGPGAARFDRAQFRSALRDCRAVVSNAGSNVLAECVALGKPVLAVYASDHHEQRLNASLVDAAQVGIGACLDTFETPETGRAVAERFARRLKTNDFAAVSLREALPPASAVVARLVTGVPVEV